jgi:hypothetical protein
VLRTHLGRQLAGQEFPLDLSQRTVTL